MRWTNTTPTSENIGQVFWVRRIDDEGGVRIAEVQEHRGALELSFTQAETAGRLDEFEYFGPLEPPD